MRTYRKIARAIVGGATVEQLARDFPDPTWPAAEAESRMRDLIATTPIRAEVAALRARARERTGWCRDLVNLEGPELIAELVWMARNRDHPKQLEALKLLTPYIIPQVSLSEIRVINDATPELVRAVEKLAVSRGGTGQVIDLRASPHLVRGDESIPEHTFALSAQASAGEDDGGPLQ